MTKSELITAIEGYDDDTEVIIRDTEYPDKTKNFEIEDVSYDGDKSILVIEMGDIVRHG
jgi:hypothetical protein